MSFRAYLSKNVNAALLDPDMLEAKYIPNLVAKPFRVTKEYTQLVYVQTSSPRLYKVLKVWDEEDRGDVGHHQKLSYTILTELLAYQFASPVRWIETQDLLFTQYKFERFIETGPSPTLMVEHFMDQSCARFALSVAEGPLPSSISGSTYVLYVPQRSLGDIRQVIGIPQKYIFEVPRNDYLGRAGRLSSRSLGDLAQPGTLAALALRAHASTATRRRTSRLAWSKAAVRADEEIARKEDATQLHEGVL